MSKKNLQTENPPVSRREERYAFLTLAVFAAPVVTVLIVAGYGFIVWTSQIFAGPPSY